MATIPVRLKGFDVSSNQGSLDWEAVGQNELSFAYLRATIGAHTADSHFSGNWLRSGGTKLQRGAYHFFWPLADPAEQATNYIRSVGQLHPGDLPPALDIEEAYLKTNPHQDVWMTVARDNRLPMLVNWLTRVEHATGMRPIIYSRQNYIETLLGDAAGELSTYPLWIAEYTDAARPSIPSNWGDWTFWQYSDRGSIRGIKGNVDLNTFNGDLARLKGLAKV
jgi:lysozyme